MIKNTQTDLGNRNQIKTDKNKTKFNSKRDNSRVYKSERQNPPESNMNQGQLN